MRTWIVRRLIRAAVVTVSALVFGFLALHAVPGDPLAATFEQGHFDAGAREALRTELGLDRPVAAQLRRYMIRVIGGELGVSFIDRRPVARVIALALRNTVTLCATGLLLAVAVGVGVGTLHGWRPASPYSRALGAALTIAYATPEFVIAILLMAIFAVQWHVLPVGGLETPIVSLTGTMAARAVDRIVHLVLPASALAIGWSAVVARQQRHEIAIQARASHVGTARAKGISRWTLLRRHVLRPALPSLVATVGTMLPVVVGGAVIVETLFAWPGLGTLAVHALQTRDYPVVSGVILVTGVGVSITSLVADMALAMVDPRLRVHP